MYSPFHTAQGLTARGSDSAHSRSCRFAGCASICRAHRREASRSRCCPVLEGLARRCERGEWSTSHHPWTSETNMSVFLFFIKLKMGTIMAENFFAMPLPTNTARHFASYKSISLTWKSQFLSAERP